MYPIPNAGIEENCKGLNVVFKASEVTPSWAHQWGTQHNSTNKKENKNNPPKDWFINLSWSLCYYKSLETHLKIEFRGGGDGKIFLSKISA